MNVLSNLQTLKISVNLHYSFKCSRNNLICNNNTALLINEKIEMIKFAYFTRSFGPVEVVLSKISGPTCPTSSKYGLLLFFTSGLSLVSGPISSKYGSYCTFSCFAVDDDDVFSELEATFLN